MPGAPGPLPAGYEFVRSLGLGASGWVVLARQVDLDRLVAVKTTLTGVHDRGGLQRLAREGQAITRLKHPHIVTAYRLIPTAGNLALVMEYAPGGTLAEADESGGLSRARRAVLLRQLAAGLAHAHTQGIVHRDVKPANVLLDEHGDVKIADFGLARLPVAAGAFRTSSGGRSGTVAYMAPEQIRDPDAEVPATDVYAFAVLAYELLTGTRPYTASGPEALMAAHLHDVPAPPWLVSDGFPVPVGRVLLAGLAKEPRARPALEELARALSTLDDGEWARSEPPAHPRAVPDVEPTDVPATEVPATEVPATEVPADDVPMLPPPAPAPALVVRAETAYAPVLSVPVYRPPRDPGHRRRAVYLSAALLVGAVIGIVVVLLAGAR